MEVEEGGSSGKMAEQESNGCEARKIGTTIYRKGGNIRSRKTALFPVKDVQCAKTGWVPEADFGSVSSEYVDTYAEVKDDGSKGAMGKSESRILDGIDRHKGRVHTHSHRKKLAEIPCVQLGRKFSCEHCRSD